MRLFGSSGATASETMLERASLTHRRLFPMPQATPARARFPISSSTSSARCSPIPSMGIDGTACAGGRFFAHGATNATAILHGTERVRNHTAAAKTQAFVRLFSRHNRRFSTGRCDVQRSGKEAASEFCVMVARVTHAQI